MSTLKTLNQLMEVQRDLLTNTFWNELCESQLYESSPLGEILSNIEYWDSGAATKSKCGTLFIVGGGNGYEEYEWHEVMEFVRTSK